MCLVRWWQPQHSGRDLDVWALDDLSLTREMYNMLDLNFTDQKDLQKYVDVHLGSVGQFCGKEDVVK